MTLSNVSADPRNPEFFNDPYPAYEEMRAAGSAFRWPEYDMVCFPGHAEVNTLFRDRRCGRDFSHVMSRSDVGLAEIPDHLREFYEFERKSLLEMEPPNHTRLRGLVNRAFVSREIAALENDIAELAEQLIDAFPVGEPFDLLSAYAEKIPVIVIARLLGVPESMSGQLLDWSHKMVAMYEFNRNRETEDRAVTATREFSDYIRQYVDDRRNEPGDDLISKLIRAEEDGERLSNDELISTVILLLNAGHEATVHAIGNSVRALLERPESASQNFLSASEKFSGVDELLRYDPPLHMFTRYVLEDFEISGVQLRKGQTVGLLLGAANHDPTQYANPDQLDFDRGGAGHTAFGAGIHFCVGAPLARLEMQVGITKLLTRLPQLKITEQPEYADRYHFHGLERLVVRC